MQRVPPLQVQFSGNHLTPQLMTAAENWSNNDNNENINTAQQRSTTITSIDDKPVLGLDGLPNYMKTSFTYDDSTHHQHPQNTDENTNIYYDTSDILTQQKLHQQTKIQNALLRKEIYTLRQQNINIQSNLTSLENQMCNYTYTNTELQQHIFNDTYKIKQLHGYNNELLEKVKYTTEEYTRFTLDMEAEKVRFMTDYNNNIRSKDIEIRNLTKERDSAREVISDLEVSY